MLAELAQVPAALIMRVHEIDLEVSAASESRGNVYEKGAAVPLDGDNYCEAVMENGGPILVSYAPDTPDWKDGRHAEFGMNAYYGIPIRWPQGEMFGTLCVLDEDRNKFEGATEELMRLYCRSIEENLSIIASKQDEIEKRKQAENELLTWQGVLNELILSLKGVVGEEFLSTITRELGKLLELDHVYVGLISDDQTQIETSDYAFRGKTTENIKYDIETAPCLETIRRREIHITKDISSSYRASLGDLEADSCKYIAAPLMNGEHEVIGVLGLVGCKDKISQDVTRTVIEIIAVRVSNELERIVAFNDLALLQKETDAASQAKSKFLAIMSHEFRTPLNAIIGFSDFIMSGLDQMPMGKVREYVEDIHNSGQHLQNVIGDILDLTKLEAGKVEIDVQSVEVMDVIQQSVKLVEGGMQEKSIHLDLVGEPYSLTTDKLLLKQILINLLSNAVKFNRAKGYIKVQVQASDSGNCQISVEDNGIGMTAEELAVARDSFVQVGHEHARREGGSGLGLSLVDGFVRLLQGQMDIQSTKGKGTQITLSFPPSILNVAP